MKSYKLKESGSIYWCRWALNLPFRPNASTDNLVRAFMGGTVARDADLLLEKFEYDTFFLRLKQIKKENEKEDRRALFAEALSGNLENEAFLEFLKERSTSTWFPALNKFLRLCKKGQRTEDPAPLVTSSAEHR